MHLFQQNAPRDPDAALAQLPVLDLGPYLAGKDGATQVLGAAGEVAAIEVAWPSGKKKRIPIEPGQAEVVVTELQNP